MAVVQVSPVVDGLIEQDLNWCFNPMLVPMRWVGLDFHSSRGRCRKFYCFFCLILNTGLQLLIAISVANGWLDHYNSTIGTSEKFALVIKIDCLNYALINIVGHVTVLFNVTKKWNPLLDTYRRIESSYKLNLYPIIRKLVVIGSAYSPLLASS